MQDDGAMIRRCVKMFVTWRRGKRPRAYTRLAAVTLVLASCLLYLFLLSVSASSFIHPLQHQQHSSRSPDINITTGVSQVVHDVALALFNPKPVDDALLLATTTTPFGVRILNVNNVQTKAATLPLAVLPASQTLNPAPAVYNNASVDSIILNRTKARVAVDSEVSAAPVSGLLHEKLLGFSNTSRKPQGSLVMTSSVPVYPTNGRRRKWPNPDGEATISPFPMDIDFVLHDPDLCRRSQAAKQQTEWLIYFHSKADNIKRRDLLRVTWASEHFFRQPIVKRVFMIGQPHDGATFTKLLAEFDQHRDLVVGNFVDSYRNLTLKSIMALKWISTYCANARYAVKADDDVFVNMAEVTSLIHNLPERKRTLVCAVNDAGLMPILRDPQSCLKWCVADTDFPGDYGYPTYCSGLAYVISMDIIRDLYEAALRTRYFFIDDVYTTGLLPLKLSYPVNYVRFRYSWDNAEAMGDYASNSAAQYYAIVTGSSQTFLQYFKRSFYKLSVKQLQLVSVPNFRT